MTTIDNHDSVLIVAHYAAEPIAWLSPEKQIFTTFCWELQLWLAYGLEIIELPNMQLSPAPQSTTQNLPENQNAPNREYEAQPTAANNQY